MINIRPVSDLRNKYPEIEEIVLKENEAVYLTKNGYGSMVVMSIEKYSKLLREMPMDLALEEKFGSEDIEKTIDEAIEEAERELKNSNTTYYTHDEIFSKARRTINAKKEISN